MDKALSVKSSRAVDGIAVPIKMHSNKELCIWIVPPGNGHVRKLRITWRSLFTTFGVLFIALVGFSFIAGDYTRMQFSKARDFVFLRNIEKERDRLKDSNGLLQSALNSMQAEREKLTGKQKDVEKRLTELSMVVSRVKALGIDAVPDAKLGKAGKAATAKQSATNMGGAEIDCGEDGSACGVPGRFARLTEKVFGPIRGWIGDSPEAMPEVAPDETLVRLDSYISTLRVAPVGIPTSGAITSGFGYRVSPFTEHTAFHEGIDISPPLGSKIFATADGVVTEVKFNGTYGLMVDVKHTSRVVTRYAHLRKASVRVGQALHRGDVIGLVGSSGRSTGPHLHYEIRVDGQAKNPKRYLAIGQELATILRG